MHLSHFKNQNTPELSRFGRRNIHFPQANNITMTFPPLFFQSHFSGGGSSPDETCTLLPFLSCCWIQNARNESEGLETMNYEDTPTQTDIYFFCFIRQEPKEENGEKTLCFVLALLFCKQHLQKSKSPPANSSTTNEQSSSPMFHSYGQLISTRVPVSARLSQFPPKQVHSKQHTGGEENPPPEGSLCPQTETSLLTVWPSPSV